METTSRPKAPAATTRRSCSRCESLREPQAAFEDVSFDVRAGEIVGLAGLVGSGRTEVARAIFGADRPTGGTIRLDGEELRIGSPREAIRPGIAMLPESREGPGSC